MHERLLQDGAPEIILDWLEVEVVEVELVGVKMEVANWRQRESL